MSVTEMCLGQSVSNAALQMTMISSFSSNSEKFKMRGDFCSGATLVYYAHLVKINILQELYKATQQFNISTGTTAHGTLRKLHAHTLRLCV